MRSTSSMVSVVDTWLDANAFARSKGKQRTGPRRLRSARARQTDVGCRDLVSRQSGALVPGAGRAISRCARQSRTWPGPLRAIIAPHAGLMYSGPVAAYAYNAARRDRRSARSCWSARRTSCRSRASRSGPRVRGRRRSVPVTVDDGPGRAIASASAADRGAPGRARSRAFAGDADAVRGAPVSGRADRADGHGPSDAGDGVRARRRDRPRGGVRATPDACCSWRAAISLTTRMRTPPRRSTVSSCEHVERARCRRTDAGDRGRAATRMRGRADGRRARRRPAGSARHRRELLQYADSGDVSGDKSSVVGYMAAAIW